MAAIFMAQLGAIYILLKSGINLKLSRTFPISDINCSKSSKSKGVASSDSQFSRGSCTLGTTPLSPSNSVADDEGCISSLPNFSLFSFSHSLIELFSATDPPTSGMAVVPFAETHPPYVSSRGSADQQIVLCTRIHNQILQRFLGRVCEYISLSISINNT
jgi:hypothetical protein